MNKKTLQGTTTALALAATLAMAGTTAWAADKVEDHSAHHPPAPATASQAPAPASGPDAAGMPADAMERQTQAMTAMHEKMMNAKTPEERRALMAEHMRAMRDGMGMMQKMGKSGGMAGMGQKQEPAAMPCDMHMRQQMLEKRMDMMQSMVQMMMDRLPEPAAR